MHVEFTIPIWFLIVAFCACGWLATLKGLDWWFNTRNQLFFIGDAMQLAVLFWLVTIAWVAVFVGLLFAWGAGWWLFNVYTPG